MKNPLLATVLAFVIAPFAFGAEEENPYKAAKVGDYATFKMTSKIGGETTFEGTVTQTVIEKTEKEVKIKMVTTINGTESPAQEQRIDLTKPYEPTKNSALPAGSEPKIQKLKEGKEKIKVKDKEYDCTWQLFKMTAKVMDVELKAEYKIWLTKDLAIPLVKTEMTMDIGGVKTEMNTEFEESGNKK